MAGLAGGGCLSSMERDSMNAPGYGADNGKTRFEGGVNGRKQA